MESQNSLEKHDPESLQTIIFGYEVPENMADKAGPFLLGMLSTYLLQAVMPVVLYYTSVTAQFLRVAFIWIVAAITICWYTGIGATQARHLQVSISRIMAQFSQNLEPIKSPNREFHLQSAETRAEKNSASPSPIRPEKLKDDIPVLCLRPSPELSIQRSTEKVEKKQSPTINVRPFLAQIRGETSRSKSDFLVPQRPAHNARPVPQRKSTETLSSRKIAYPQTKNTEQKVPRKPLQPVTPTQSQKLEFELQKMEAEALHLRRLAHPRHPSRQSSYGHTGNSNTTNGSLNSRRNSTDSLGSTQKSTKLNKPLPRVMDKSLEKPFHRHAENLDRSNSVVSKQSVLGTRANYSKFLANVDN